MSSTFDPEAFLTTQYTDATDTHYIKCPEGEWLASIDKITSRKTKNKDGSEGYVMDVMWEVQDEKAKKLVGADKLTARQSIFLDVNEQGNLDMSKGKNVKLGILRDACGQNKSGKKWAPMMLKGSTGYILVSHEPNPDDPDNPYVNVIKVGSSAGSTSKKNKAA